MPVGGLDLTKDIRCWWKFSYAFVSRLRRMWKLLMRRLARKWGIISFAQSSSRANQLLSFLALHDLKWHDTKDQTLPWSRKRRCPESSYCCVSFLIWSLSRKEASPFFPAKGSIFSCRSFIDVIHAAQQQNPLARSEQESHRLFLRPTLQSLLCIQQCANTWCDDCKEWLHCAPLGCWPGTCWGLRHENQWPSLVFSDRIWDSLTSRHVSCCWSLVRKWMMKMMMPGDSKNRFGQQMLNEIYNESLLRPGRLCAWRQRRDMKRSCSI